MSGLPVQKAQRWSERLNDLVDGPSNFEIRGIVRDVEAELKKTNLDLDVAMGLYLLLGQANFFLGKFAAAEAAFNSASRLPGGAIEALKIRALCRLEQRKFDDAFSDFSTYIDAHPEDYLPWANVAELFYRLGLREQAQDAFAEAKRLVGSVDGARPGELVVMMVEAAELNLLEEVRLYGDALRERLGDDNFAKLMSSERHWVNRVKRADRRAAALNGKFAGLKKAAGQYGLGDEQGAESALVVLDEMEPLRHEAMKEALGGTGDVEARSSR